MMSMRFLVTTIATIALVACGSIPGSPGHISEEKSTFDGTTTISVSPGHASGCCSLGARWRSGAPDYVQIVVKMHGTYAAIQDRAGLEFNVDGQVIRLDSTGHPTRFDRDGNIRHSTKAFVMRRADFQRLLHAEILKVRLNTLGGYVDGDLLENAFMGSAIEGFRALNTKLP